MSEDKSGSPGPSYAVRSGRFIAFTAIRILIWILAVLAGGAAFLILLSIGDLVGVRWVGFGAGLIALFGALTYAIYLLDHKEWGRRA